MCLGELASKSAPFSSNSFWLPNPQRTPRVEIPTSLPPIISNFVSPIIMVSSGLASSVRRAQRKTSAL